jgi:hypothetical protein
MGVVGILAIGSTHACIRLGLLVDMPLEIAGIAIVFPIVFSIGQAFQRRERALSELAEFEATLQAVGLAHRDWPSSDSSAHAARAGRLAEAIDERVRSLLRSPGPAIEAEVDELFSELSSSIERLRDEGNVSATEISRLNQYLRQSIASTKQMRNIAVYRTPRALRSFTRVFLTIFPVVFGPYFAYLASPSYPAIAYGIAILYTVVLVGLDNIQEGLENPYDGIGVDDIHLGEPS